MAYQRQTPGSKSINLFGGINVASSGGGADIRGIRTGTFSGAMTSAIGQSSAETATFTLSGATTGDLVVVWPSTALEVGISLMANANVTATSTVTVTFVNETSVSLTQTSGLTHRYLHIKL